MQVRQSVLFERVFGCEWHNFRNQQNCPVSRLDNPFNKIGHDFFPSCTIFFIRHIGIFVHRLQVRKFHFSVIVISRCVHTIAVVTITQFGKPNHFVLKSEQKVGCVLFKSIKDRLFVRIGNFALDNFPTGIVHVENIVRHGHEHTGIVRNRRRLHLSESGQIDSGHTQSVLPIGRVAVQFESLHISCLFLYAKVRNYFDISKLFVLFFLTLCVG